MYLDSVSFLLNRASYYHMKIFLRVTIFFFPPLDKFVFEKMIKAIKKKKKIVSSICKTFRDKFKKYTFFFYTEWKANIHSLFRSDVLFLSDRISVYVRNYLRVPQEQQKNHSLLWFLRNRFLNKTITGTNA